MYCNILFLNRNIFKVKLWANVYLYPLYEINKMINKYIVVMNYIINLWKISYFLICLRRSKSKYQDVTLPTNKMISLMKTLKVLFYLINTGRRALKSTCYSCLIDPMAPYNFVKSSYYYPSNIYLKGQNTL